jgi:hypothetical protein
MNLNVSKMDEKTTIAFEKVPLSGLSYREVVIEDNDRFYLENVNILIGRKIIKKIRFKPGEKPYVTGMGKDIAIQYLRDTLIDEKNQNDQKSDSKKYEKVNEEAAMKAASDLFTEIGL